MEGRAVVRVECQMGEDIRGVICGVQGGEGVIYGVVVGLTE